jgi:hypothetical protein
MGRSVSATLGLRIRYWLELPPMMPDNIRINPAFRRHPEEAEIIGRLVVGFGEIEIAFCTTAAKTLQIHGASMYDRVMRSLYTIKVTSARLDVADQLMRPSFEKEGLAAEYLNTVDMVNCCRGLRNQYAHCNWTDNPGEDAGLFFADLQDSASSPTGFFSAGEFNFRHIDVPILQEQELYFSNTMEWLNFLDHEIATLQGRLDRHSWPAPSELRRPPFHSPPEEHVPPWLSKHHKDLHLARAKAAKGGPPTPTPAQITLDNLKRDKRARKQAQRERNAQGQKDSKTRPAEPPKEDGG